MTAIDQIKKFLIDIVDISIGYSEINFFPANTLEDEQVGYSVDPNGESLITGQNGDWQEGWIAIANDNMGDPFIVDTNSISLKILSAAHGEGAWEPLVVADSLDKFKNILSSLMIISRNRTNPVDLEKNPISDKERQAALKEIEIQNPGAEIWFWEMYFEN